MHYNYFRSYSAERGRYTQADPIGLGGGFNRFGYVGGNALGGFDRLGLYESPAVLRATVPGQFAFDTGMTALEHGNYGAAGLSFGTMVGEQVLTVASLGLKRVVKPVGDFCEAAAKEILPAAAAKIDPVKIREIERIVRSGETYFPLDTGAQLRAVAESFASKVRGATSPEVAAHIRDVGLGAIDRLDRFKALTPEAMQHLRNIVNGAYKP